MRNRLGLAFLPVLVGYVLLLEWAYRVQVAPRFGYLGQRYREPDTLRYVIVITLVVCVAIMLPRSIKKASDFVTWIFFVIAVVPAATVPQYADVISQERSFQLAIAVTANYAVVLALAKFDPFRSAPLLGSKHANAIIIALSGLVYLYLAMTTGLRLTYIAVNETTDTRFAYRDQIATAGPILGYLVQLQGNILNPLIIAKGIAKHRWSFIVAGAFGQLLIYSLTGYKLVLISIPALLLTSLIFRRGKLPSANLILHGTIVAALVAIFFDSAAKVHTWTDIFINRLILIPGTLTAAHVLVYDGQPKAVWAYSFLRGFVQNPYDTTPAFRVGAQFTGNPQATANANFFADGYANYGWIGISIEALFLVLLLWTLNAASRHLSMRTTCLILLVPSLALVNSSVFTTVLTGGFLFAIVIMVILPKENGEASDGVKLGPRGWRAKPVAQNGRWV